MSDEEKEKTYCRRSAASYSPMFSVLVSSMVRITSPDKTPALYAGPPGEAEMTTSPPDGTSALVG
jgi:hypothetical protein